MNCPNCGAKIKDGTFLCYNCGCEINFVPDFDPEVESSIEESLSGVIATMGWDEQDEDDDAELDLGVDEEMLNRFGLGEETKRMPTREIPVNEVRKRIPTQEISSENIRKMSKEQKQKMARKKMAAAKAAAMEEKSSSGNSRNHKTSSARKPEKKNRPKTNDELFEDEFSDEFWDVEEALDFTGSGRIIEMIKNNVFAKIAAGLVFLALVGIIVAVVVFISGRVKRNSFDYKYEQAVSAFEAGDYAHAVSYMESAANMHSDDLTLQYQLAEYYVKNNQTQNAILTYRNIIRDFDSDVVVAYQKLFSIYESQGDFESINSVLAECNDPEIVDQFQQYLATQPEFSATPGAYDDPVYLKIMANTSGKIYYTTDGSTPDNESNEYTAPLYLEKGAFDIKAIYINSFGLMSPITEGEFTINVAMPDPPKVNIDSGEIEEPELIVVEDIPEDCVVYYTTDGSEPNKNSNVYKYPLMMPLGSSTLQFVTYNFDDVPSEITVRDYLYLIDQSEVTAAEAANIITVYRYSQGNMTDTDGNLQYLTGRLLFMCENAIKINDTVYYVINEYYQDDNSNSMMKTGYIYAVSTVDDTDYGIIKVNSDGDYIYTRVN